MEIGDKLTAKWTESITDHVTKNQTYTVVDIDDIGFYIINDKGNKCFPISTTFTKIS